jgi:hypothetical protein
MRFTAPFLLTEPVAPARSDMHTILAIHQSDPNHLDLSPDKSGANTQPSFIMMSRRKLALGALYLHKQHYKMTA